MTRIEKENSTVFATIQAINKGTQYLAAIRQGEGFNEVYLATRMFKTEAGARRWVTKQFLI